MSKQMEVVKLLVGEREINTTGEEESNISHIVLKTLQQGIGVCILVPEYPWSPMDRLLYSWAKSEWGVGMEFRKESSDCASSTSGSFGNECGDLCEGGELAAVSPMKSRKECSGCAGSSGSLGDKCDQSSEIELADVVVVESRKMEFRKESSGCAGRGVLMRKINGDDEKTMLLHWRGLARTILGMCSHYYDYEGTSHVFEYNQRCKLEKLIKGMEDNGLHPTAFAYKQTDVEEIREDGLILLAILGVKYREETKLAMHSLREAGVNIKLMMGDELSNDAHETFAFGRSSPEDKLGSIRYLKQQGHVVGFYGGFTTDDTSALKEADEMARESSDIIVLGPGRFIVLQLTTYISGILIIAVSTMSLGESPITTIQLGWANLIVYMLGGMMMAMELPTQGLIMAAHQPQPTRTKSIMTKPMWRSFAVQFVYQVSVLLIIQFEGGQAIHGLDEQNVIKTMIFNTFILCQVFNLFNTMELEKKQVFMVVVQSYCFLASVAAVLAVQVLLILLATILTNYARLNWVQWAFCFLFSSLSWVLDRVLKFIYIFLSEMSVRSMSSTSIMSQASTMPIMLPHVPITGFMFSVFVFFSLSYCFKPDIAWTIR
ncbi:Calcium-transporting ATPase 12, plasma membrane-type [Camellia lanceoleosa]|uniref:Calcium-transporting ATPase 12, plasma membrane-type n=1 Tax=Camellia lanceoleosa TaxID=1840588 RepID=A0ACC0HIH0_9ERIC|nr:Calcium-transporting ATPase 12, plasma membrane-type [Camellia lanceoleosa]